MDLEKMKKCMEYQKSVGLRYADGITDSELFWLIEQAEIISKIKSFCSDESDVYADLKMDEKRHKVDRIFFNGKQRAFNDVIKHIENLEES